jgi:hypothetical protein
MSVEEVLEGKRSWHIECSDALAALGRLPSGVVHCVVSSPPYF